MKNLRTLGAAAMVGALVLTGCGGRDAAETGGGDAAAGGFAKDSSIGVALPQKTSENWVLAE